MPAAQRFAHAPSTRKPGGVHGDVRTPALKGCATIWSSLLHRVSADLVIAQLNGSCIAQFGFCFSSFRRFSSTFTQPTSPRGHPTQWIRLCSPSHTVLRPLPASSSQNLTSSTIVRRSAAWGSWLSRLFKMDTVASCRHPLGSQCNLVLQSSSHRLLCSGLNGRRRNTAT